MVEVELERELELGLGLVGDATVTSLDSEFGLEDGVTAGISIPEEEGSVDPSRTEVAGVGFKEVRFLLGVGTSLDLPRHHDNGQTSDLRPAGLHIQGKNVRRGRRNGQNQGALRDVGLRAA